VDLLNYLSKNNFKKNKDSLTVFYPWGGLSKGYVVQDSHLENNIRSFLKVWQISSLIIFFSGAFIFGWVVALFLLQPILFLWFHLKTKRLLAELPLNSTQIGLKDPSFQKLASPRSIRTLWISSIGFLLFAFICLLEFFINPFINRLFSAFCAIFFGAIGIFGLYLLKIKKPNKGIQADAAKPHG